MSAQFEWIGDFLAQGDEGNDRNRTECERRQKEMAARLDALLMRAPALGYSGFEAGGDWPTSRYDEVWRASIWLSAFPGMDSRPTCSSYYLKHAAEKAMRGYISNGSLIAAASLAGLPVQRLTRSPNAAIGVPIRAARAAYAVAGREAKFSHLTVLEPKLRKLADEAKAYRRQSKGQAHVCANSRWYGYFEWKGRGLKGPLCKLVGWESSNPILNTEYAYDLAYDSIFKLLPFCKNCNCRFPECRP